MEQPSKITPINFLGYQIKNVVFNSPEDRNYQEAMDFSIGVEQKFTSNNNFEVDFKIEIKDSKSNCILDINAIAFFHSSNDITEDFKKGTFHKVNAPAIFFPYLRAYITNLTALAGNIPPLILPTYNFTKWVEQVELPKSE